MTPGQYSRAFHTQLEEFRHFVFELHLDNLATRRRSTAKPSAALDFAAWIRDAPDTSEVHNHILECPEAVLAFSAFADQASDALIEKLCTELSAREERLDGPFSVLAWCVWEICVQLKKTHPDEWDWMLSDS